jgi:hypothetical protein
MCLKYVRRPWKRFLCDLFFPGKNMNFACQVTYFINRGYLLYALSVSFAFHYSTHTHSLLPTDKLFLTSNGRVR